MGELSTIFSLHDAGTITGWAGDIGEVAEALRYSENEKDRKTVSAYGKRMNNRAILQRHGLSAIAYNSSE
jgi:predicted transcriptional regulator of viral defense system